MSTCWLLQPPSNRHDLSGLSDFGTPVVLFNRGFFPDDVEIHTAHLRETMDEKLTDFNQFTDYIVPLGDSCVVATVADWFSGTFFGEYWDETSYVQYLKYDKKLRGFYVIKI